MRIHLESGSFLLSVLAVAGLISSVLVDEPLKGLLLEWGLAAGMAAWLHYLATQAGTRFRPAFQKVRVKARS